MNENANIVTSFRQVIQDASPLGRRHRIGPVNLREQDLEAFNHLLSSLGWSQGPLTLDQMASVARAFPAGPKGAMLATYIRAQLDRGSVLARMVADRGWEPANDTVAAARAAVTYLASDRGLIPNWVPSVGRLDDALVIETAWPSLAAEVVDFQDFCRMRQLEAWLRGVGPGDVEFGRCDWVAANRVEVKLREQRRILRQRFHESAAMELFRVG
ncbi:MAG: hypothetical protein LCH70_08900 [Proteobacteria bacterium]|nr:hypothetical protein [Pseudomonadota bacterium]